MSTKVPVYLKCGSHKGKKETAGIAVLRHDQPAGGG